MSKSLAFLSVASFAAASCSVMFNPPNEPKTAGETKGKSENPSVPFTEQRQRTDLRQVYMTQCANCHGQRGEGGGGGTKTLNTRELQDQKLDRRFFDAIKKGVPDAGMEAYEATLSDPEIWGLVVLLREFQHDAMRGQYGGPTATNGVYSSKHHRYRLETVVDRGGELRTPWSIDWLPDRTMLVTNRPGYLSVFRNGQALPQVANLPTSIEQGQGGLMEVAVHPNYARNGWIYLSYTEPAKDRQNAGMTKIVRGKLTWSGNQATWGNQQTIWEAEQEFYTRSGVHFGSKIVFDGKGHIFFTVGERGGNELAQNLASPFGKNYRLNEDGSIPQGNPFTANQGDGKKHVAGIWSIGHRNQQGLALDLNGNLWVTEHGPRGGDELNLIEKGANYGWPTYAFSIQYNGTPLATPWPPEDAKITLPLHRWIRSTGASGLDTVTGNAFPNWKGDLLAGGLAGQNVDRFRIKDGKIVEHEELIWNQGRIRDVRIGSDGNIYLAVNGPDMIVRMVPVN